MKLRTLIIDDEYLARDLLRSFLRNHPQIEIIGECENGFEGIAEINELKPDLVLLDIQMPRLTGLEMLDMLAYKPHIIFTTAYDQYALKAFELCAVDYLLKPFSKQRLLDAMAKVIDRIDSKGNILEIDKLQAACSESLKRVVVKDKQRIVVIPVEDIFHIEAMDDYVLFYTKQKRYVKQCTMKSLEKALDEAQFVRIHRSHIVQLTHIERIEVGENDAHFVQLKSGKHVKVSKSGYKRLKSVLGL
ncbi:MAG: LytR/AlgR family response regulator transcription factor [Mangrovibacterium sp.]